MKTSYDKISLNEALRQFEAAEANLAKLDRIWEDLEKLIPQGICSSANPEYEDRCHSFRRVIKALPAIDGWTLEDSLYEFSEIVQMRLDVSELGDIEAALAVEQSLQEQPRRVGEYRSRLRAKRRELARNAIPPLVEEFDTCVEDIDPGGHLKLSDSLEGEHWEKLRDAVSQMETLLGASMKRPERWRDLRRHLHFGQLSDYKDIIKHDWPTVKSDLPRILRHQDDPVPVTVADLGDLVRTRPSGSIVTKLKWEKLSPEAFERLLFCLISEAAGYENPEWLTHTNAADRGRDLSATRVYSDSLGGTTRHRVIIQCKHWIERSIGPSEIGRERDQMAHWEPPRVDVLVIATSGRFTSNAVALIEKHNLSDRAMKMEPWPETHLELLLASRPSLVAEFGLR